MKTLIFTLITALLFLNINAQYYEPTGKIRVNSLSITPLGSLKTTDFPANFFNVSLQRSRMLWRGIYLNFGYSYMRSTTSESTNERSLIDEKPQIPINQGHVLSASFEVKKMLFSTGGDYSGTLKCFYRNIGISLSPEYNYLLPTKGLNNESNGEFALRTGLYYHHGHTKRHRRNNRMYTIYYKKSFTPLLSYESNLGTKNLYYDEVGIKFSVLIKQLYRFGW